MPPALGGLDGFFGVDGRRRVFVRGMPRQHERHALSLGHGKLSPTLEVLSVQFHSAAKSQEIRPRDRFNAPVHVAHPRHDRPVIEADDNFRPHPHLAAAPDHKPYQVRPMGAHGHAIDHGDGSALGLEVGFEHQGSFPVAALGPADITGRAKQPAAVFRNTQEGCKTGRGVESRQAQPVDGTVATDQCRSLAVADQSIIFDA